MVFGNLGEDCGTGVAFTRDPSTGENVFYGEYLINAQGEDVVAGIRTPQKIATLEPGDAEGLRPAPRHPQDAREALPATCRTSSSRSSAASSACCRRAPASAPASPRSGSPSRWSRRSCITPEEAVLRVNPDSLNQLLRPIFDPAAKTEAVAAGRLLGQGPQRRARRGDGPRRLHGARRLRVGRARREGAPRPRGDEPRGHQGHERGRGHPHGARRHDVARGPRRAADGQGLHRRVRGRCASTRRRAR